MINPTTAYINTELGNKTKYETLHLKSKKILQSNNKINKIPSNHLEPNGEKIYIVRKNHHQIIALMVSSFGVFWYNHYQILLCYILNP